MPVRNLRHYDEEFDYIELTKQTQETPIQDYAPEVEPAPQLSELLYFLNIAIFCVLTVVFSFVFLATKMNTFFAFALAIGSSFASIQGFRIYYNKRKNKNQVFLIFLFTRIFLIGITIGRQNLATNYCLTFYKKRLGQKS